MRRLERPLSVIVPALALGTALALAACNEPPSAPPAAAASATAPTDAWAGQWNGPEGTFLRIAGGAGRYEVTVRNLDGERSFAGTATAAPGIAFVRDGTTETLRATDGAGTGMKWLRDKTTCLAVRAGEGYCRD